jgi:chemotaxis protein MotB
VEGHTDDRPIHTAVYPSNRFLSAARASSVADLLVDVKGLDPTMVTAEGMGEYWPVDTNDTAEGRANNRRVEIKVYARYDGATGTGATRFTIPLDD